MNIYNGIVAVTEDEVVSTDFIGTSTHSYIFGDFPTSGHGSTGTRDMHQTFQNVVFSFH